MAEQQAAQQQGDAPAPVAQQQAEQQAPEQQAAQQAAQQQAAQQQAAAEAKRLAEQQAAQQQAAAEAKRLAEQQAAQQQAAQQQAAPQQAAEQQAPEQQAAEPQQAPPDQAAAPAGEQSFLDTAKAQANAIFVGLKGSLGGVADSASSVLGSVTSGDFSSLMTPRNMAIGVGALGVPLVLVLGVSIYLRRRRSQPDDEEYEYEDGEDDADAVIDELMESDDDSITQFAGDDDATVIGSEISDETEAAAADIDADLEATEDELAATEIMDLNMDELEELDVDGGDDVDGGLSEFNVLVAYGHYDKALDLIDEKINENPDNVTLKIKRMEVYASQGDQAEFEKHAASLKETLSGDSAEWKSVEGMWEEMGAGREMFSTDHGAGEDLESTQRLTPEMAKEAMAGADLGDELAAADESSGASEAIDDAELTAAVEGALDMGDETPGEPDVADPGDGGLDMDVAEDAAAGGEGEDDLLATASGMAVDVETIEPPDAGLEMDAGGDDAGLEMDTGDTGVEMDAGGDDAGLEMDTGDAGVEMDAGGDDAGLDMDAGDAGLEMDAGGDDAGLDMDTGDAGLEMDAGGDDAGLEMDTGDAGVEMDSGDAGMDLDSATDASSDGGDDDLLATASGMAADIEVVDADDAGSGDAAADELSPSLAEGASDGSFSDADLSVDGVSEEVVGGDDSGGLDLDTAIQEADEAEAAAKAVVEPSEPPAAAAKEESAPVPELGAAEDVGALRQAMDELGADVSDLGESGGEEIAMDIDDTAEDLEAELAADEDEAAIELDDSEATDSSGVEAASDQDIELDLDIGDDDDGSAIELDDDGSETDPGTKLDLARAYIELGDTDSASDALNDVIQQGNDSQRQEAQTLLSQIG